MKQYSNFRFLIEYIIIVLASYFILSGLIAFIGNTNYRGVLCYHAQGFLFIMIYAWLPIPRMIDMVEHNSLLQIKK